MLAGVKEIFPTKSADPLKFPLYALDDVCYNV